MIHNLAYPPHIQYTPVFRDGPAQAPPAQHDADVGAAINPRREPDVDEAVDEFELRRAVFVKRSGAVFRGHEAGPAPRRYGRRVQALGSS